MLAVLCLDIVVAVGLRLRRVHGAVALDVRTAAPVFSHAFGVSLVPVRVATQFVKVGNPTPYAVIVLGLAALALIGRDRLGAVVALVAPPVAVFSAEHLKTHFGRTEGGGDAYPSGHTTALTALAVVIVLLAMRRWGPRSLLVTLPVGIALSGGMVLTVVRLHDHLMSDALGGMLLGVGVVVGIASVGSIASSARPRSSRREAARPSPE